MKNKSLLLTFLLILSMLSAAWADDIITIVADGQTISDATTWENSTVNITGSGKVTFSKRITISGDVTLNLGAGATLTASFGITVNEGNCLTIAGDGTLNAGADNGFAAIGGTSRQNSGTINITGGTINATGRYGAGIGGGRYGSATIINISGGNVTATGDGWSAGIGGGSKGNAGMITITGGVVSATGNYKGAGIGGGGEPENPGGGGTITISGGQVTATGGKDNGNPCGYGIGPGKGSSIDGTIGTISLSWTESTDFINASSYKGTISFEDSKRFYYDGTTDYVTADELANKLNQKIVPAVANNNSLEFADIQMPRYYITTNGTAVDVNYDVYDYDGNKLMLGTHYTAVIKNSGNEDVTTFDQLGDYTLTVTGTGTTYTGRKSFTFSLVEWDSNLSVDGSDHYINFPSDGTKKTVYLGKNQTIKVYDSEGKNGNLVPSDGRLMLYAPEGYALEVTGKTDAQFYASAQYWTWLKAYDGNDETETALITKIDQNSDNISFGSAADGMLMRFYVYNGQSGTEEYGLDLTVRVVEATSHNITVGTADNGSIASDKTSAKTNEIITLTVNPANGYLLKRITVADTDNGTTIATIGEDHWYSGVNTVALQMPNKNITVTPEYAHVLTIDDGLTLYIDPMRTTEYVIPEGVTSFKIYGTADNGSTVTAVLKAPEGVRLKVASDYRYDVNYNLRYIDCTVGSTNSYIKIYDGENTSSALLKELTYNDRRIGTQTSTSNYITFEIHGSVTSILQGIIEMEYSINYDLAGGSVAIENPVTYTYATANFTLNKPCKDGYEFAGWTGTGLDAASTNVTIAKGGYGNREYTATWTPITYTVSFDANGGTGDAMTVMNLTYDEVKNLTANTYTPPSGYVFAGWNSQADGDGTDYADQAEVSNLVTTQGANIDLFAQWKKSLENPDITIENIPKQTYTGMPFKPEITIIDGKTPLSLGIDYTVTYSDNTNAGTATVTITGKGNYGGELVKTFKITKADPTMVKAPVAVENLVYNGKAQTLVTAGEAKNGVMVYKLESAEKYSETLPTATEVGEYTVYFMVLGNENYNDLKAQTLTATIAAPASSSSVAESSSSVEESSSSVEIASSSSSSRNDVSSSSVLASSSSKNNVTESSSSTVIVSSSSNVQTSSSSVVKSSSSNVEIASNSSSSRNDNETSSSSRNDVVSSSSRNDESSSSSSKEKKDGFAPVVASGLKVRFVRNELAVTVPTASEVKVYVFDLQGNLKKQYHGHSAGTHNVSLNQMNRGLYLVRVVSGSNVRTLRAQVK